MNQKDFKSALIGKTVPLLILDQKWHRLFAVHGKTTEIKTLESKLHNLLTEQSKLNTRLKIAHIVIPADNGTNTDKRVHFSDLVSLKMGSNVVEQG